MPLVVHGVEEGVFLFPCLQFDGHPVVDSLPRLPTIVVPIRGRGKELRACVCSPQPNSKALDWRQNGVRMASE